MRWVIAPLITLIVVIALIVSGVVGVDSPPGSPLARLTPPKRVLLTEQAKSALAEEIDQIAARSDNRAASEMTLRIRNLSCGTLALGSGFALTDHLIVTNDHVVSGAQALEINTWDGRDIRVDVDQTESRKLNDLALIYVRQRLPRAVVLGEPAAVGDQISVVGYPEGGPLRITRGRVIRRVSGYGLGGISVDSPVLVLSATVQHGSSGGPVLDSDGKLIGIIYAGRFNSASDDAESTAAYAIPARTLIGLLNSPQDFSPIQGC